MVEPPKLEFRPIDSLLAYARNARTHSSDQVAQIAASINEWGWTNAVLADDECVVSGQARVLAAAKIYAAGGRHRLPNGAPLHEGTGQVGDGAGCTAAPHTRGTTMRR